jgi:hypothetical protein
MWREEIFRNYLAKASCSPRLVVLGEPEVYLGENRLVFEMEETSYAVAV